MTRRVMRRVLLAAALLCAGVRPAHADGLFVPWFGGAFSQDPDDTPRASFGAALGSMSSAGLFGFEIDFGYTPSFFGNEAAVSNNAMTTMMADLIVGPTFEGRSRKGAKPYGVFGVGVLHPKVGAASDNDFGWNAAGGVMGFLSSTIGLRFDLRYFRSVDSSNAANTIQLKPGALHFWRASVGLVIR